MKRARMVFSAARIANMLNIPDDAEILKVKLDKKDYTLELEITHPGLKDIPDNANAPRVSLRTKHRVVTEWVEEENVV